MDELKGFIIDVQREVHKYQTVKVGAYDQDDALERFYEDDCVTIDESEKVRDTVILGIQEES